MKKALVLLALLLAPCAARAQVEVIVRLSDDAGADLSAAMTGAGKGGAFPELFEAVSGVRSVFGRAAAGKSAGAPFAAFVLTVADSSALETVRARWAAHPGVAYAQPNHRYRIESLDAAAFPTNDPLADSLDHLAVIRAEEAWTITTGSPDVRIGQIDTGLFFEHPDLAGQIWVNPGEDLDGDGRVTPGDFNGRDDDGNGFVDDLHGYDFVDRPGTVEQGDFFDRDPDPSEDNLPGGGRGHGTTVAGVLVAGRDNGVGISGVAPGARLVPLRAFGADGIGDDDDIAAALVYAAETGLDVVNLSFGDVFESPLMHEAIRYAVARGTVVVASAGNLGGDGPHYPSDYPEVISTAWFNAEGTGIASRGTFGLGIDLGAPGSQIYTTLMPGPDAAAPDAVTALYGRRSGSSMAAPMVSAAAALLRSLDPSLTPAAVRAVLTASARDVDAPGWDHRTAAGVLDVANALLRALPARTEIVSPPHNAGLAADTAPIVGTVVDPSFDAFSLFFTPGDEDPGDAWTPLVEGQTRQVWRDTLAVWDLSGIPDGVYTLRLVAALRTGGAVEDRRRVFVDRTPPRLTVHLLDDGLVGADHGVVADVATDDLADVRMELTRDGTTARVDSDRRARRHGLVWADRSGAGGAVTVRLIATNVAGLETTHTARLDVPARATNEALFEEETLSIPHGFLLPKTTDFDRDGLLEITLNRYENGWLGDTLATYEWAGGSFAGASAVIANVFPRDAGDADGDGLLELLTQVGGATLLLEQPTSRDFPFETAFLDTTGLANPFDTNAAFGARLTDLDGDGRGEILVHNTKQWRVLEYDGTTFSETARLENPTGVANTELDENDFQEPEALVDDFDGDGHTDLLVGDSDGDWIMYENTGEDAFRAAWTYETDRYNAGSRFAKGDFDGDGVREFVTFTQNWTQITRDGEREPDVGLFFFWERAGDDAYAVRDSLPVAGPLSRHGSMTAADFDGDGRDELVIVHAPDLYVLAFDASGGHVIFHRGAEGEARPGGFRSIETTTGDFDGDGAPELIAAGADERLHRFVYRAAFAALAPPQWGDAFALDAGHVRLAWRAVGADSVTVFAGDTDGALDPLATTDADTLVVAETRERRYALRAWYGRTSSPLTAPRTVRPHAPAVVAEVGYPADRTVELVFTEPLASGLRAGGFRLDGAGAASALLMGQGGRSVVLRFEDPPATADTLRWADVRDAEGTPVGQTTAAVLFPAPEEGSLIVTAFEILDRSTVTLLFSAPLDPAFASDASNYRVLPEGAVAEVLFDAAAPDRVTLRVAGRVLGATGLETSVEVLRMRSLAGQVLAPEGRAVRLVEAAADLSDVYVFPNPYRAGVHRARLMIAGLPAEATVRVFSLQGGLIRVLEETDGDGGTAWDLRDEAGRAVPSGVYLIRVEAPGQQPVLRKAALIR